MNTLARQLAFPRAGSENRSSGDMPDGNEYDQPENGMTKREYFAGLAMQSIILAAGAMQKQDLMPEGVTPDDVPHITAIMALDYADALLEALDA